ncbi:MAG: hypothetical protein WCO56_22595 [Verrucomicrobiota bacterium]
MNPPRPSSGWSQRIFIMAVLVVFGVHLTLALVLGERISTNPMTSRPFHMVLPRPGAMTPPISDAPDYPVLFALANRHGFSRQAWLQVSEQAHVFYEWTAGAYWLTLNPEPLGSQFVAYVQQQAGRRHDEVEKTTPALTEITAESEMELLPNCSRLHLTSEWTARRLLTQPQLPSWPNSEVLKSSVVLVGVSAEGHVANAVLVAESGLKTADATALELTRQLRFDATPETLFVSGLADARPLQFGRVVFQWLTVAPTNQANVKPIP